MPQTNFTAAEKQQAWDVVTNACNESVDGCYLGQISELLFSKLLWLQTKHDAANLYEECLKHSFEK